jgi:2-hydroxycyclohexanecarboxyl-CoA dehydrogenase
MSNRVQLKGARVVVTGAGSGIGEATALRFAGEGAQLIAVDINGESAAATAARCSELAPDRPQAESYVCDVADSAALTALAADLGTVDVLVNNAGVGVGGALLETGIEDWDWLIGINLDGVAYGCYAFGPGMVERGRGHVVNVASAAAYLPHRSMAAYCASKAAVFQFSQCLRADWASRGVGVSVICPGLINTPIPQHTRMFGGLSKRQEQIVRGFRFGHSPDLVAKAIVNAVRRNQGIVPVGLESSLAYRVLRFTPAPIQNLVARVQVG